MKWQDKIQPLKIEREEERDYTIHGKRIEAKTFPYENLKFQPTTSTSSVSSSTSSISTSTTVLPDTRTVTVKTTDYTVTAAESNVCFTNDGASGAVIFTLPSASAGLTYTFIVEAVQTVTIDAAAGNWIRIDASVTSNGGTIYTSTRGNSVTLVCINTTNWVAISFIGTWTFT